MIRLQSSIYLHTNLYQFFSTPISPENNHKQSISGTGWDCYKHPLKTRRSRFLVVDAVEKDSEFEVDPVEAREALRKLDEQLQSLAQKKIDPPKVRASEMNRAGGQMTEENPEFSESFFVFAAGTLLIFTIFYNILFLTVIKPSIDGPETIEATSPTNEAERDAALQ